MLTSFLDSYKTWIFAKNSDDKMPVARLIDFVINPETGVFEAFWVEAPEGLKLISPKDILQWTEEKVLITDVQSLMDCSKLPRLQKILEKEIPILKAEVFCGKKLLGKVVDFVFDTISPRILSLTVKSGFWFFGVERIIRHNRIKKITKKGIFVSNPDIKVTSSEKRLVKSKKQIPDLGEEQGVSSKEQAVRRKQ